MIPEAEFILDSEEISQEEKENLSRALRGLVCSDAPLCVEISLVLEDEIRRLNREIRGIDAVTDVLSFPSFEPIPGEEILSKEHADSIDEEGRLLLGSVAICVPRAKEQAAEFGHSEARELNYLAVHGILHCLGYDHTTEELKAAMREKEEVVMRKMNLGREE